MPVQLIAAAEIAPTERIPDAPGAKAASCNKERRPRNYSGRGCGAEPQGLGVSKPVITPSGPFFFFFFLLPPPWRLLGGWFFREHLPSPAEMSRRRETGGWRRPVARLLAGGVSHQSRLRQTPLCLHPRRSQVPRVCVWRVPPPHPPDSHGAATRAGRGSGGGGGDRQGPRGARVLGRP